MSNYWLDMEEIKTAPVFRGKFQEADCNCRKGRTYPKNAMEQSITKLLLESKERAKKRKYRWGLNTGKI